MGYMVWGIWRLGLGVMALGALTACDQQGFSGLDAEWERARQGPYYVVAADHDRAVVSALGRQVAIEPSEGFCLARESIETSRRSAFALIGDCVLETAAADAPRSSRGELQLPRGVPGIITVSISGDPGIPDDASRDEALNGLSAFLETAEGRRLLGRSGTAEDVRVLETRRIGDGVYVLLDDAGAEVVPVLDPTFWRAFVELNDRLAVVTVSGFRDRPLGTEPMLKYLVTQVQTLEVANAEPIDEAPSVMIAAADPADAPADSAAQSLAELEPESVVVVTRQTAEPVIWPVPTSRPDPAVVSVAAVGGATPEATTEEAASEPEAPAADAAATRFAPETAPTAPRRPRV